MYFGLLYGKHEVFFQSDSVILGMSNFLGGWGWWGFGVGGLVGAGEEHLKQCDHFSDGVGHVVNVMVQFLMRLVILQWCNL